MCGLVGYFSTTHFGSKNELVQMGNALEHRGPDDSGVWLNEADGIAIAHQRLAVVELSQAGAQPMQSASGRYVIAFNGEIYNHQDLRETYLQNYQWKGRSDTETIVQLIEKLGVMDVPQKLVGMFAIVVWDQLEKKLYLIRDRFGEKPIYYGFNNNRFFFTSELKALRQSENFNADICTDALSLYFQYLYIPSPYSIFRQIFKAPSGKIVSLDTQSMALSETEYWSTDEIAREYQRTNHDTSVTQTVSRLEELLNTAVSGQMVADVSVGAFLSGGVDSSTVVSIMSEQSATKVNTYSIGFNTAHYNEAHHARAVAKQLNTHHQDWYIDDTEVPALVTDLIGSFDEPFADSSQIATHAVAKLASKDVTVCLTGDGGDELFGGYTRYQRSLAINRSRKRLGRLGKAISEKLINTRLGSSSVNGILEFNSATTKRSSLPNRLARAMQLLRLDTSLQVYEDMASYWRFPASPALSPAPDIYSQFKNISEQLGYSDSKLQQLIDLNIYMQDDILVKVDRTGMSKSLETRIPFLDHRFASYAWSIPANTVAKDKTNKSLLLEIAQKRIPVKLLERPKQGFSVPLAVWLSGPLRPLVEECFNTKTIAEQGLLNSDVLATLYKQFFSGRTDLAELMWSVVMFQSWYKTFRH